MAYKKNVKLAREEMKTMFSANQLQIEEELQKTKKDFLKKVDFYLTEIKHNFSVETIEYLETLIERYKQKCIQIQHIKYIKIDIKKLKRMYKEYALYKKYPKFDFKKLDEYYTNPITKLKSKFDKGAGKYMIYDNIVSRKYLIAIIQMVFSEMDLIDVFVGGEGSGKTTTAGQYCYLKWFYLTELNLIDYDFTLKKIMVSELSTALDLMDKTAHIPFQIVMIDEGTELNRKDWYKPNVQMFFQKLRRERSCQRLISICLPQLGELMPAITLSRVNFGFQLKVKTDKATMTTSKDNADFFIIPRGSTIYSHIQKREVPRNEIINELGKLLDDKKLYFKKLPNNLILKEIKKNGVWAFNKYEYNKMKFQANMKFSNSQIHLTDAQQNAIIYMFDNLKTLGLNLKDRQEYLVYRSMYEIKKKIIAKEKLVFENKEEEVSETEEAK